MGCRKAPSNNRYLAAQSVLTNFGIEQSAPLGALFLRLGGRPQAGLTRWVTNWIAMMHGENVATKGAQQSPVAGNSLEQGCRPKGGFARIPSFPRCRAIKTDCLRLSKAIKQQGGAERPLVSIHQTSKALTLQRFLQPWACGYAWALQALLQRVLLLQQKPLQASGKAQ